MKLLGTLCMLLLFLLTGSRQVGEAEKILHYVVKLR